MKMELETWLNSLCINITNRCDTYCRYCFQESNNACQDYIGLKDIKRVLDFFAEKGAGKSNHKYLQLTGGEVTLHPEFLDMVDLALSYGYDIRLQTNGISLSDMPENLLKKLSSPRIVIKVSLDGWDERTHEYFRAKGSFQKIIKGIKRLRKVNEKIGIKTVVHPVNFPEIYKMLEICKELRAGGFDYNILNNIGRAETMPQTGIDEFEVVKLLLPYFNIDENKHLLNGNNILMYYLLPSNTSVSDGIFFIDYKGFIYPNQLFREKEKIGTIFGKNLDAEFDVSKLVRQEMYIDPVIHSYIKQNLKIE